MAESGGGGRSGVVSQVWVYTATYIQFRCNWNIGTRFWFQSRGNGVSGFNQTQADICCNLEAFRGARVFILAFTLTLARRLPVNPTLFTTLA